MSYSGSATARQARENLSRALGALQEDANIPPDVMAVTQNIAQAVGALFEAERASSEPDGKASVKAALGLVSQTLALLQEVSGQHRGVQGATEALAGTLSLLFPLSTQPSRMPPPAAVEALAAAQAQAAGPVPTQPLSAEALAAGALRPAPIPAEALPALTPVAPSATAASGSAPIRKPVASGAPRQSLEVNIGATTESNFYVGFSGDVSDGGVFAATYNILPKGTPVRVLVTLPGGFEKQVDGYVRFVVDPMDMTSESDPGMGIQFEALDHEARELVLRFIRKRPPMFFDE